MIKLLSNSDFSKLEDSLYNFSLKEHAILAILMYCGLRVGELILLKLKDLNLDDPKNIELHVRGQTTKTKSGRFIPIPPVAHAALHEYIHTYLFVPLTMAHPNYLFPGSSHRPYMSVHGIEQLVNRICYKVLHKHVTPHTLRHTYATKVLKFSNIREVQLLLGHKKLSSTEIYTHPNMLDLSKTVKKTFS